MSFTKIAAYNVLSKVADIQPPIVPVRPKLLKNDKPAMIGVRPAYDKVSGEPLHQPNEYFSTLMSNFNKTRKPSEKVIQHPQQIRLHLTSNKPAGIPYTQNELLKSRAGFAGHVAGVDFEPYTPQYNAAYDYLMQRGAENQKRLHNNTLKDNLPTEVPVPDILKNDKRFKNLHDAGYIVGSNSVNNGNKTIYS